jgi:hypothetical protein
MTFTNLRITSHPLNLELFQNLYYGWLISLGLVLDCQRQYMGSSINLQGCMMNRTGESSSR